MNDYAIKGLICVGGFLAVFLPLYLFADPGISPLYAGAQVEMPSVQQSNRQVQETQEIYTPQEEPNIADVPSEKLTESYALADTDEIVPQYSNNQPSIPESTDQAQGSGGIVGDLVDGLTASLSGDTSSFQEPQTASGNEVIVDEAGVRITYTGWEVGRQGYFHAFFLIENNTDYDIMVASDNTYLNGYGIFGIGINTLQAITPNRKSNERASATHDDLERNQITTVTDLEMTLIISKTEPGSYVGGDILFTKDVHIQF